MTEQATRFKEEEAIELDVSSYNNISENILADNEEGILLTTANGYDTGSHYNSVNGNNMTAAFTMLLHSLMAPLITLSSATIW